MTEFLLQISCTPHSHYNRPINTSMDFFKLVFLFILVSFFNFATNKAQDSGFSSSSCLGNTITPNSTYHLNLKTLLSYLSSNATSNKEFYNTTVASKNHSDIVYGLFMCRGDIPSELCGECVRNATQELSSKPEYCSLSKEAVIWRVECMVRYSNHSFFSIADLSAPSTECSNTNASNQTSFMRLLSDTMNQTADDAANSSSIGDKKYATKQARISGFQSLYCLAQCTPDLSPQDCRRCLSALIAGLEQDCEGSQVARAENPTCNIRYDLYPFYRPTTPPAPTGLVPATKSSLSDSKYSQDPGYLSHNCSSNETVITNSAFLSNLRTLLSALSSNATSKTGFYKTTIDGSNPSDTVNGLFMCRGDISPTLCQLCVLNATQRISLECHSSKEAIIWFNHCLLRYSYRSFFSTVDTSPIFHEFDIANTSNLSQQQSLFNWTLVDTLSKLEIQTSQSSTKNYGTKSVKLNDFQTLYTLGQCTPDLSDGDCVTCLQSIFLHEIPWCCLASPEGVFLYPSCYMMFGLSQFYRNGDEAELLGPASPSPGSTEKRKRWSRIIILIVVPVASVMLFCFGYYLLRRKERKRYKTILKENFGDESATLEPLQFDLAIIEAATNNFSNENMIGKGGFGEVYKGILLDGRRIAVKRLSKSSKQGAIEFKTEILLIAKLQHRNLVTFIGFCLKEQEKILVYEYVPNGSLDYFLFDTQQQKLLNWSQRYKIIEGIARGILYLHEYSRLKVIHRDLKPSNVLLDENMNPKLSDFGIARIVEIDQHQESTNRIVGTFGYMSPEYAMLGYFSEKSDVFSFGVMILEIVSGKKNVGLYESRDVAAGLLSYVWRQWRDHTPLSILDPKIKNNYSEIEVIKCIQIGLLCVQENSDTRPTMVTVISYLSNHSIKLPSPQEPAFFRHGKMDQYIVARESSSGLSINNSSSFSINEMSISECLSR